MGGRGSGGGEGQTKVEVATDSEMTSLGLGVKKAPSGNLLREPSMLLQQIISRDESNRMGEQVDTRGDPYVFFF